MWIGLSVAARSFLVLFITCSVLVKPPDSRHDELPFLHYFLFFTFLWHYLSIIFYLKFFGGIWTALCSPSDGANLLACLTFWIATFEVWLFFVKNSLLRASSTWSGFLAYNVFFLICFSGS